jgi:RND family efflux transporter MFP subunit
MRSKTLVVFFCLLLLVPWGDSGAYADNGQLDGFIEPYMVVNVGSEVSGIIEVVTVDRGDFVEKGQVLAVLDSRVERTTLELIQARAEMEAEIQLRRARVDFATREHERINELFQKGIIPDFEMDEAKTGMIIAQRELQEAEEGKNITEMELRQAEAVLARREIRCPIKGVVVERLLSPGELVGDQPIMKLAQLDPLNVEVFVPVSMLGSIKVGMKARVTPESPMEKTLVGRVTIVDRVVDAASGTFGVRIELSNLDYSLPAGLKCRVRFL